MGDANKELVSNLRHLVELVEPGKSLDDRRRTAKAYICDMLNLLPHDQKCP